MKTLILELFPHCNLNCDFCFRNPENNHPNQYNEELGRNGEYTKIDYIKKAKETILKHPEECTNVDILYAWGGEIFYDNSKEFYDAFVDLLKTINAKTFHFNTNLIEITDLLKDLVSNSIEGLNFVKVTPEPSYDCYGRYKSEIIEQKFLDNLDKIKSLNKFKKTLTIYVTLQKNILNQTCDLTTLEQLYNNKTNKIMFLDNTLKYDEETIASYNENLLNLFKRFPYCENVIDFSESKNISNNGFRFCLCCSKDSHFLTYSDLFEFSEDRDCLSKPNASKELDKNYYDCENCEYSNTCSDVCPSALINSGLNKNYCYRRYILDRFSEINFSEETAKQIQRSKKDVIPIYVETKDPEPVTVNLF